MKIITINVPEPGDQVYYDGVVFGHFGHVVSIEPDGRMMYSTGSGLHGFSYVYKYENETWYLNWETANKERNYVNEQVTTVRQDA